MNVVVVGGGDDEDISLAYIRKLITNQQDTEAPFYVLNLSKVVQKFTEWSQLLPRVELFYAMKCNDHPQILETLAQLGGKFDCASESEISRVLSLGVPPEDIVFANPCKLHSHLAYAARVGVRFLTFDSLSELYKVKTLHPSAKLILRYKTDAKSVYLNLAEKYGCDPVIDAPKLLERAKELELDVVGVSFHVGTGCDDLDAYRSAIVTGSHIFKMAASLGYKMDLLDIGGGYMGNDDLLMRQTAEVINKSLSQHFPDDVRVIAEPGRYVVSDAVSAAAYVHGVRTTEQEDGLHQHYTIALGVYAGLNGTLLRSPGAIPTPLQVRGEKKQLSTVWGPTCDSIDKVIGDIQLPPLTIGDWLLFTNVGAYSFPIITDFNGFPRPKIHVICNKHDWNRIYKTRQNDGINGHDVSRSDN